MQRGEAKGLALFLPTAIDPTLAPPGEHIFACLTFVPYDIGRPCAEAKADYKAATLRGLDRLFPGFSDHLIFADSATPVTALLDEYARLHLWLGEHPPACRQ